ncbi:MerR family transcriptional regulator [Acidaminobacter hydrogenoformans]|uniref:DNA-binding transcriptional regulator, MerR family n=1 Tax=Acidaminobacter hydrogenoformans DSM 2784 TaxID=1120920 RepID=A0A1G5RW08_9FIRM|nr:MerR family transcriptional regulator [Acidaminobacter hydrogenoformans]SCZ78233.1 DNA-binding transcriptional regulator, MerR family [Acidaminobacter hydrogenoformans DSM 2784]
MEMTIQRLSRLAGVSSRTLRYYDELGLLKPLRVNSAGYRIYGRSEVDRLQQILFYRELGLELERIKALLDSPGYSPRAALESHREALLEKRRQLDLLIKNVEKTMAYNEGRIEMTDKEKFEGFKKSMIESNEARYGKEVREKYGNEVTDASNKKLEGMTEAEYAEVQALSEAVLEKLAAAMKTGTPGGAPAQEVAALHKQWLMVYWPQYSGEAHAGLAEMYVADERFTAFYDDKCGQGAALFLRDAIRVFVGLDPA